MKRFLGLFLAIVLVTFLFAAQSLGAAFKWPKALAIGTPAVGSSSHAVATAWTPVLEQSTGMKVRIIPEGSQPLRARWLKQGIRIDLNMESVSEIGAFAMTARGGHATRDGGPYQVRIVWLGQSMPFGFVTTGDSGIKTIYDIKPGTPISYFMPPPASVAACDGIVAWANLDKEDITVVPFGSYAPSVRSVWEGKAALAYAPPTSSVIVEGESSRHGLHWLPLDPKEDPEGAKRFLKYRPTATFGVNQHGVKSAIGVPMLVSPFFLYAHANKDAELVYNLSKWIHQNFNAYKDKHANCELMSLELFRGTLDYTFLPVHEGTITYLKEIGKWGPEDDIRNKYNTELIGKYEKAYARAIKEADKKKISVDPQNKEWTDLWESYKKQIPPIRMLMEIPQ